jgi:hypothetical protein
MVEVSDGGDKVTRNNTPVNVETPSMAFLEDLHTCRLSIKCRNIRIFGGTTFRFKEFFCKWRF